MQTAQESATQANIAGAAGVGVRLADDASEKQYTIGAFPAARVDADPVDHRAGRCACAQQGHREDRESSYDKQYGKNADHSSWIWSPPAPTAEHIL